MNNRGKTVSILGDSVSTYAGFNPSGYSVFYDDGMTERNGIHTVYDTWWAKVNQYLNASLCVNNSYSGSKVTGKTFPSASCEERLVNLRTDEDSPDIILIYIGFNDFGNGIEISAFEKAYKHMLMRIGRLYPDASVICATLMKTCVRGDADWEFPERYAGTAFEEYNNAIRRCCQRENILLADLADTGLRYETLDGSHPTADGHLTLSTAWINFLQNNIKIKEA